MKLEHCTHGCIVINRCEFNGNRVGMIVGITNNCHLSDYTERSKIENAVVEVQWSSGEISSIHPANIVVLICESWIQGKD